MKQLAEFIKNGDNFAIISHVSPDGDTMGSAAALLYALKKLNKIGGKPLFYKVKTPVTW